MVERDEPLSKRNAIVDRERVELLMSARAERKTYFREHALDVYLLRRLPWDQVFALQQRLVFERSESPRNRAALILAEHPSIVTVGRQGSHRHIRSDARLIDSGHVPVKWTNRGGGAWHQQPGQLAIYPILPLEKMHSGLTDYRTALYATLVNLLEEFKIIARREPRVGGLTTGDRVIASVGIAVKQWMSYHGAVLNVAIPVDQPPLADASGDARLESTCMFRELRTPVRVDAVREAFLRHFVHEFGFNDYYLSKPPAGSLGEARPTHAWALHD